MSRKLALIVGNSEYEDETLASLVNPDTDVKALAEVLRDPEVGGFDEVTALINEPSTTIRRSISRFFMKRVRDDLLLLYFSGHGIRDDRGQLFLGVKDTEHDLLRVTAIPAAFITEEMDNSRSRRQVLILDCCHSGAFSRGMKAAPGASVGTAAAFEGTGSGRVVLTATDSTQYAWEGGQVIGQAENSVFTHYLIKGLRTGEADTAGDGRITLDELYDYVYERVVHETPLQTPSKWSYGQQGELVIAKNPNPVVKTVELHPELIESIEDPRSWVREGAVRELDRLLRSSNPGLALAAREALNSLVDDDSRRVSTLAAESLAAYDEARRVEEETKAAEMASAEAERQANQKAKKERRLTREKEQAERRANEEAEGNAREIAAQGQLAIESADRERLERETALGGREAAEGTGAKAKPQFATILRKVVPDDLRWPLWLTTIGWATLAGIGWVVSEANGWVGTEYETIWTIIPVLGGLITGLALRQAELSIHWKQLLMITIGWTISSSIGNAISMSLYGTQEVAINGSIRGAIGGLITGLALRWAEPSIQWKQILLITAGWTIGWTIGTSYGDDVYDAFYKVIEGSKVWWAFPGAIWGAISVLIGSGVMYWQLGQWRHHSVKAGQD